MKKRNQLGFTLVEIAIVLVIVGLLLGAVLKGQELIFNSKVKSTYNMSKEMAAAIYSYQDRYRRLPGDDTQAATRFPAATPVPSTTTLNFGVGQTRANNAVMRLGLAGELAARATISGQPAGTVHVVVDVTGYFVGSGF